jgi:ATP-dependent exoDNAse (exonuclease V) alpha subunit
MKERGDPGVLLMDYGYVLTVHKAQGSAWSGVLILEQIAKAWDVRRWRYTATTRATDRVVYCF